MPQNAPKTTAIYLRVSSRSQDLRSQESDLKRWAESQDAEVRWYRDKTTGTKMERPGMDRLLADVEAGKIGRVVVWRLDRLGRTAAGLTKLFADLQGRKVGLYSLKDARPRNGRWTLDGERLASVAATKPRYDESGKQQVSRLRKPRARRGAVPSLDDC